LVPGAAVTVEGTWRLHHFLADGPTLVVSRHGSADDAGRNRASALLHLVRYAYAPVPHGLTARWSWEPGFDGAVNQVHYRTVAAQRPRGTTTRGPR
jgi:hypothetical protein